MEYIQLDNFNGNLSIVCKNDDSGEHLVFDTLKEAEDTLEENCQDGVVIPLNTNIIQILKNCNKYIYIAADKNAVDDELSNALNQVLDLK